MTSAVQVLCKVTDLPLSPLEAFEFARSNGHGAQNFFFGAVRAQNAGRDVVAVSYEAFVPLATRILEDLAKEAQERWGGDLRIYVAHRTGTLQVGDISVAIGVCSRHRHESYMASRHIIEQIKHRAPIWKKEHYSDGETEWLKGHALCQMDHDIQKDDASEITATALTPRPKSKRPRGGTHVPPFG